MSLFHQEVLGNATRINVISACSNIDEIKAETVSSVSRIGMRGRELMGGVGKTMMQSGGTFGTFMSIGMGIRC